MVTNQVFHGKRILLVSEDMEITQKFKQICADHGGIFYYYENPKVAVGNVLSKKPNLVIFDDRLLSWNGIQPLSLIKRAQPLGRILLLTRYAVPHQAIDSTALGVSYTLPRDCQSEEMYNALKHSLSITSVPRVETKV